MYKITKTAQLKKVSGYKKAIVKKEGGGQEMAVMVD